MSYHPKPINTSLVQLPEAFGSLVEALAKHSHDLWAEIRLTEGWTWGPERDDQCKKHPSLIDYMHSPRPTRISTAIQQ